MSISGTLPLSKPPWGRLLMFPNLYQHRTRGMHCSAKEHRYPRTKRAAHSHGYVDWIKSRGTFGTDRGGGGGWGWVGGVLKSQTDRGGQIG